MAKQDFLNGGYVGKLGVTVGQRWKNIRTIRTYVIPKNPRTELQQSNRAKFSEAIHLSSLSMAYNKGSPIWQADDMSEYNKRTQLAKTRLDNGITGWLALPLYPQGSSPETTISNITIVANADGSYTLNSDTLVSLTEGRSFTFSITMISNATGEEQEYFFKTTTTAGQSKLATFFTEEGYSFPNPTNIIGITNDDSDFEGKFIYIPPQQLLIPQTFTLDDLQAEYIDNNTIGIKSQKSSLLQIPCNVNYSLEAQNATTSSVETLTGTVESEVGTDYFVKIDLPAYYALYTQNNLTATATPINADYITVEIPTQNIEAGTRQLDFTDISIPVSLEPEDRKTGYLREKIINNFGEGIMFDSTVKCTYTTSKMREVTENINVRMEIDGTGLLNTIINFANVPLVHFGSTVKLQNAKTDNDWIFLKFGEGEIEDETQHQFIISEGNWALNADSYPAPSVILQNSRPTDNILEKCILRADAISDYEGDEGIAYEEDSELEADNITYRYIFSDQYFPVGNNRKIMFCMDETEELSELWYSNIIVSNYDKVPIISDSYLKLYCGFDFGTKGVFPLPEGAVVVEIEYTDYSLEKTFTKASNTAIVEIDYANSGTYTEYTSNNWTVSKSGSQVTLDFLDLPVTTNADATIKLKNVPVRVQNTVFDASQYSFNYSYL